MIVLVSIAFSTPMNRSYLFQSIKSNKTVFSVKDFRLMSFLSFHIHSFIHNFAVVVAVAVEWNDESTRNIEISKCSINKQTDIFNLRFSY